MTEDVMKFALGLIKNDVYNLISYYIIFIYFFRLVFFSLSKLVM